MTKVNNARNERNISFRVNYDLVNRNATDYTETKRVCSSLNRVSANFRQFCVNFCSAFSLNENITAYVVAYRVSYIF